MSLGSFGNISPIIQSADGTKIIKLDSANNKIIINDTVLNKTIEINSEEFTNGIQTLPYVQMYEKINACEACIYPPQDSLTLKIVDNILVYDNTDISLATSQAQITSGTMNIQDINGSGTRSNNLDAGSITITDGTTLTTYIDAGDATFSYIGSGQNTTINPSFFQANDGTGNYTTTMNNNNVIINDNTVGTAIEILNDNTINASPYLRIQNTTGQSNYLYFNELNADDHFNFKFNNNNSFFKQMNPFSFNQIELFDGNQIEKYYPFIFCQNVSNLNLYDYTQYLDDNSLAGWSFIISNYSGSDLSIDTHGLNWYAHSNGLGGGPINIKKWVQCRITLVYSSIDNEYLYSVSQF